MSGLSGAERLTISRARQLAAVTGAAAVREYTGVSDTELAYACALGEAQHLLAEVAAIAERPGGSEGQAAEDTRRLAGIRTVLAGFDWEYHDRQLALEAIERIAEGGQA